MKEVPSTPTALARYLITYISDDSAIATHIKNRFGLDWTVDDIAQLRSTMPKPQMIGQGKAKGVEVNEKALTRVQKPYSGNTDPLLRKLAAYHYKRANSQEAQRHWWALM